MILRSLLLGALAFGLWAAEPADSAKKLIADKKYDEAIAKLEPAYKTKPAADLKKLLADANLGKADTAMADPALMPRQKYPTALRAYREVLKYDPANQKAKTNIEQIEGIYKQMGRPIPQ